jgi:NAD-dependent dihydropyrimidine dehydrogenase PreA subunit
MRYLANVATLHLDIERCTGCGRCAEVCPHGVFAIEGKKARVVDRDLCMECGACMANCAFGAVEVGAGVGCASALIKSMITGGPAVCGCSDEKGGGSGCC